MFIPIITVVTDVVRLFTFQPPRVAGNIRLQHRDPGTRWVDSETEPAPDAHDGRRR